MVHENLYANPSNIDFAFLPHNSLQEFCDIAYKSLLSYQQASAGTTRAGGHGARSKTHLCKNSSNSSCGGCQLNRSFTWNNAEGDDLSAGTCADIAQAVEQ